MAACHIAVSGFELDLYDQEESLFMRWYTVELYKALAENLQATQLWKTTPAAGKRL